MPGWTRCCSTCAAKDLDSIRLPLDIRATAFQRRVWAYLQSIPFGATRSYSQVAKGIGRPSACSRRCAGLRDESGSGRDPVPSGGSARTAAWAAIDGASSARRLLLEMENAAVRRSLLGSSATTVINIIPHGAVRDVMTVSQRLELGYIQQNGV